MPTSTPRAPQPSQARCGSSRSIGGCSLAPGLREKKVLTHRAIDDLLPTCIVSVMFTVDPPKTFE
jgi:hypothetical protein